MTAVVTVYSRQGCHLCEQMLTELNELRLSYPFDVVVIDVDNHPQLRVRYDHLLPVLSLDDEEVCHYTLDVAALWRALNVKVVV